MDLDFTDLFKSLEMTPKPWFILTVGAPGSGKTTLAKAICLKYPGVRRFSTDDKLEVLLKRKGKRSTEDLVCQPPFGQLVREVRLALWQHMAAGKSALLDQTSMTREARAHKLAQSPPMHTRICIELPGLTVDELERRVKARVAMGGRHIPRHVIAEMLVKYERPEITEGFHFIYRLKP